MSEDIDRAAACLRQALKFIPDNLDDAAALATKAAQLLKSASKESPDDETDDEETRQKNDIPERLQARNERRARMGLGPLGAPKQAIRVEKDQFIFSPATLARSRGGRVRA